MPEEKLKLKDKIALVTGASTGIGQAIAKALAKQGAIVAITSRHLEDLKQTAQMIGDPSKTAIIPADLNLDKDVSYLAKMVKFKFGKIDIFIHAAAVWHTQTKVLAGLEYDKFDESQITETMNVGILSPMVLLKKLLPTMQPGSKIVNITGTFKEGGKGWVPYYVSKQALEKLTLSLAEDFKDRKIQVNAVSPGDTLTPAFIQFFPQYAKPNICVTPELVAKKVLQLVDPDNSTTGKIVVVQKSAKN